MNWNSELIFLFLIDVQIVFFWIFGPIYSCVYHMHTADLIFLNVVSWSTVTLSNFGSPFMILQCFADLLCMSLIAAFDSSYAQIYYIQGKYITKAQPTSSSSQVNSQPQLISCCETRSSLFTTRHISSFLPITYPLRMCWVSSRVCINSTCINSLASCCKKYKMWLPGSSTIRSSGYVFLPQTKPAVCFSWSPWCLPDWYRYVYKQYPGS